MSFLIGQDPMFIVIVIGISIPLGFLLGHSLVYGFNHMPAKWLTDYGKEPSKEVISLGRQRLSGMPWKYVFSASFIVMSIYLGTKDVKLALPIILTIWLLVMLALADSKYKIIPDEICIFIALGGICFIPKHSSPMDMLLGASLGIGVIVLMGMIGKLIWHRETIGFGDGKLCGALGIILGFKGVALVMIGGFFLAGLYGGFLLITRRAGKNDEQALGPFLAVATIVYLLIWF